MLNDEELEKLAKEHCLWAIPHTPSPILFNSFLIQYGRAVAAKAISMFISKSADVYSVNDLVGQMIESKSDRCELAMFHDGKKINVRVEVLGDVPH